jgi:WD40 repeat protein
MDLFCEAKEKKPIWLACGCSGHSVKVFEWGRKILNEHKTLCMATNFQQNHQTIVVDVRFSPNGKYLAAIDQNGLIVVWSNWIKAFNYQVNQEETPYKSLAWNYSSTKLAVANMTVEVLNLLSTKSI